MKSYAPVFLVFLLMSCSSEEEFIPPIRPVKAIQVPDPSLIRSRPFPGVTRAEQRVNLSFRVSGPLVEFPVDVGDEVGKGDVLARIDPQDYEVALKNSEASLERGKAALSFAESDYERAMRIQNEDPGAISQSMVDRKREERNKKRADIRSLEAGVEAARDQLEYTYLRAPFDGVIVSTYVENFESVQAKQSVVRMLDSSLIEMVVDIPELLISYVPNVEKVMVTLDPFPGQEFEAKIKEVGTEASKTTRTYPVTLILKQPKEVLILSGMSGEAKFVGKIREKEVRRTVLIPPTALLADGEDKKSYVWVIAGEPKTVSRREVTLGALTDEGVRITNGLEPGEWIATAGIYFLNEGQEVRILGQKE